VQPRAVARRTVTLAVGVLVVATGCSSSHGSSAPTTTTTSPPTSTTANPDNTPNSIPYEAGEKIGLAGGWLVLLTGVHLHFSPPGLPAAPAGEQYVAISVNMENQGPGTHTVNAARLFTMVDTAHKELFVVASPGKANGLDGVYRAGTTRTGQILFLAPTGQDLGLVLYGPLIGAPVSDFTIVPPTVPNDDS